MLRFTEDQLLEIQANIESGKISLWKPSPSSRELQENTPRKRLSDETVHAICHRLVEGTQTEKEIADEYKVSYMTVVGIKNKRTYRHISETYDFGRTSNNRITRQEAEQICNMLVDGVDVSTIARAMGVTGQTVRSIRAKATWRDVSENYDFSELETLRPSTATCGFVVEEQ